MKKNTGAYEWGGTMITIAEGCGNGGCRYCYAREMACRLRGIKIDDWPKVEIRPKEVEKSRPPYKNQPVFFQSASDITPTILKESIIVMRKLLEAGNQVLIVSKPHLVCIEEICNTFRDFKKQILFRFTIGSTDDATLKFWDRGAPKFLERYACLVYARQLGYKTSVSCEPYLDDLLPTYRKLISEITDTFWVGKLNDFKRRVDMRGITTREVKMFIAPLLASISDTGVRDIYARMKNLPKVRFKDSIREVINQGAL